MDRYEEVAKTIMNSNLVVCGGFHQSTMTDGRCRLYLQMQYAAAPPETRAVSSAHEKDKDTRHQSVA